MGSLNTKIMIWNMALDLLREQPLAATTDEKATAKWLSRNYDQQRDYLLERLPWKFALNRSEIAADATAPAWALTLTGSNSPPQFHRDMWSAHRSDVGMPAIWNWPA